MTVDPNDVESFLESVSEVAMLVAGLKEGTISPDYIDTKVKMKKEKEEKEEARKPKKQLPAPGVPAAAKSKEEEEADEKKKEAENERLMAKVEDLKNNRARKLFARHKFEQYVATQDTTTFGTDYNKWDMYCPEDEEDDMINSMCPNQPQFKAMEKDIEERHKRMVEQRQLGERARVAGNEAFKSGQFSEALRCYQAGLESNKTNMALHGNAAMAALKINCFVQAVEHCDKVLNIADFFNNNTQHPLCVKAYQRRATAFRALQQHSRAVADLEAALAIEPNNTEAQLQLRKARCEAEEVEKQKALRKAMDKGVVKADSNMDVDLERLRQVEKLVGVLIAECKQHSASTPSSATTNTTTSASECSTESATGAGGALPSTSASEPGAKPHVAGLGGRSLPTLKHEKPKVAAVITASSQPVAPEASSGETTKSRTSVSCATLSKLLDGDDASAVYFRECGGMQAACSLLQQQQQQPLMFKSKADLLSLLNAACMNDGNLAMLPALTLPATCVALLKEHTAKNKTQHDESASTASAALLLLCTAATNDDVRKVVSKHVGSEEGLIATFQTLSSVGVSTQAVALTLLGNCMVDKCTKDAMRNVLQNSQPVSDCLQQLLTPASSAQSMKSSTSTAAPSTSNPLVTEKAMNLVGNMCGDSSLRQALQARDTILSAVAGLACTKVEPSDTARLSLRAGALTALYNLSLDAPAQLAVQAGGYLPHLLSLTVVPASDAAGGGESTMGVAHRAAGIVSRCAKHPEAQKELLQLGAVATLLSLAQNVVASKATSAAAVGALDASVRVLAQLTAPTAHEGGDLAVKALVESKGIVALTDVMVSGLPLASESVLGNASNCLGNVARYPDNLAALAAADVVAPLVKVAYDGKGNSASKNSAIALAKMAHNGRMMEQLRELHGLEIIYTYVKP